jgi:DNA-binding response OmpR family regulator
MLRYAVESTDANTRRVLVVEDESSIAEVCRRVLRSEGFQVEVVPDGKAALNLLNEEEFVFVLVDVRTPGMNGMELHRRLESIHPEMAKRVVFTTGDVLSSDIKRFLEEVARPYLAKPFTPGELKAMARSILDERG